MNLHTSEYYVSRYAGLGCSNMRLIVDVDEGKSELLSLFGIQQDTYKRQVERNCYEKISTINIIQCKFQSRNIFCFLLLPPHTNQCL
jgi:hypothetical protein